MNTIHQKKFNYNTLLKLVSKRIARTKQHKEEIQALLRSSRAILEFDDFRSTARSIFETCKELIGASAGYVSIISERDNQSHVIFLNSDDAPYTVNHIIPIPIKGLSELAYQTHQVVYDNAFAISKWADTMPSAHIPLTNVMVIPLMIQKKGVGLIGLANKRGGFTENDCNLASVFGEFAAIALYNSRLLESIKESEYRYRSIFDSVNDPIIVFATETGELLEINDQVVNLFGYCKEELQQLTFQDLLGRKQGLHQNDELNGKIEQTQKNQGQVFEWSTNDKEGNLLWLEVNLRQAVISGKPSMLGVLRNITERKQLEREIAHIDRLNTVSRIAAGIAHEIRNPMTTVKGFLQLMSTQANAFPQFEMYSKLMIEELDRANAIITEFLSIVKDKAVELMPQDLNQIIQSLLPLIQTKAAVKGKEVEISLKKIRPFPLNEQEIKQLVLNLVRNAFEAMEPGGKVKIETLAGSSNEVIMKVKDEGCGIDPENMGKLGTPFFTTKDEGTGLGLAICHSIASRHRAAIHFDSCLKGTTVEVRFQISEVT